MQTLDDKAYFTTCGILRIHKNKTVSKVLYGFLYAKLIQLAIDDVIAAIFSPASANKWFFWFFVYLFLVSMFTLWDSFVYHLYKNVQKDPLLFSKLQQIAENQRLHADDYRSHAHSLIVLAMSPRRANPGPNGTINIHPASITVPDQATLDRLGTDGSTVTEIVSPSQNERATRKALSQTTFWTYINTITFTLDFVRLFLFGYVITTAFTKFNEWLFPGKSSSLFLIWLCAYVLITVVFVAMDCVSGKFEQEFLHSRRQTDQVELIPELSASNTSDSSLNSDSRRSKKSKKHTKSKNKRHLTIDV